MEGKIKMNIEMGSNEALELALNLINQELEWVKQSERTDFHHKLEEAKVIIENMMDDGLWELMGEFIEWCRGEEEEYKYLKNQYGALEHDDFTNLICGLNAEQYNYVETNLEEFLIQSDMNCEREKAIKIIDLMDYVSIVYYDERRN
jgi:hypothetical protein